MHDLPDLAAVEVVDLLRSRQISSREMLEAIIARVDARDGIINALPIQAFEAARNAADAFDAQPTDARSGTALHGLPIVIKDQLDVAGLPTTQGFPP